MRVRLKLLPRLSEWDHLGVGLQSIQVISPLLQSSAADLLHLCIISWSAGRGFFRGFTKKIIINNYIITACYKISLTDCLSKGYVLILSA